MKYRYQIDQLSDHSGWEPLAGYETLDLALRGRQVAAILGDFEVRIMDLTSGEPLEFAPSSIAPSRLLRLNDARLELIRSALEAFRNDENSIQTDEALAALGMEDVFVLLPNRDRVPNL